MSSNWMAGQEDDRWGRSLRYLRPLRWRDCPHNCCLISSKKTPLHNKPTILHVRHGGGSAMLWGYFSSAWPRWLVKVVGNINAETFHQILDNKQGTVTWKKMLNIYAYLLSSIYFELMTRTQTTITTHSHWTARIQSSKSTSSERFILLVMVEKIRRFCLRSGSGNSIFLSKRPGRSRAGSKVSALLVAMITWGVSAKKGTVRWITF